MPRTGRIVLPHYPHHIVQRGHNRQVVFAAPADFERYLSDLRELKEALGIKVYAYCLMTNHVHLLLAPGESTSSLGQLMKALAGRMTRYRNKVEGRTGTLWESRYIELNPVRARMVARAEDYRWSSFALRLSDFSASTWLDKDPCFLELGPTDAIRRERYKSFIEMATPTNELQLIRGALQRSQLTGNTRFVDEIEKITGKRIDFRARGRPEKDA
ncbi:transposase [Pseudomonas sp. MWU12-2029]|uniref:transposase n=1 Tax=Pseudomonas sp. MWU12-2029 TaxID=2927805 RepID=UPI00200ED4C3|nr:transposase [Pseudomonas sp. MWU12-2029]